MYVVTVIHSNGDSTKSSRSIRGVIEYATTLMPVGYKRYRVTVSKSIVRFSVGGWDNYTCIFSNIPRENIVPLVKKMLDIVEGGLERGPEDLSDTEVEDE